MGSMGSMESNEFIESIESMGSMESNEFIESTDSL
jgi:hypothetical protein